jgi:hypothetical protein
LEVDKPKWCAPNERLSAEEQSFNVILASGEREEIYQKD